MRTLIAIGSGIALGFLLFQWNAPPAQAKLITGTNGPDRLTGTPHRDHIFGKNGPDIIWPKDGHDVIRAGASHDHVHASKDGIRDVIYCGPNPETGPDKDGDDAFVDSRDVTHGCENIFHRGGGAALSEGAPLSAGDQRRLLDATPSLSADVIPRWLICHTVDDCHNPPPRPLISRLGHCTWDRDGAIEHEWDQRLGTFVPWECKCYTHVDGCHWIRRPLQHRAALPWWPPHRRYVKDARRACQSIVCKTIWVRVRYPTRNIW